MRGIKGFCAAVATAVACAVLAACSGSSPSGDVSSTTGGDVPSVAAGTTPSAHSGQGSNLAPTHIPEACRVVKLSDMAAVLGRPVQSVTFDYATARCTFGALSAAGHPQSGYTKWLVFSYLKTICGSSVQTDLQNDPALPGEPKIRHYEAPWNTNYWVQLPGGCALSMTPGYDDRHLGPKGGNPDKPQLIRNSLAAVERILLAQAA